MNYPKSYIEVPAQIELLKSRGLIIPDEARATEYLSNISYYRLSAYARLFQKRDDSNHTFQANVDFDQILDLYLFDRKLRLLVFDAIERTEIALRTQIINQFSSTFGTHWFEDPSYFKKKNKYKANLKKLDDEIERSGEAFINHYRNKYTHPQRPPVWMCFEVASMGLLSKIYSDLKMNPAKKEVARYFELGHPKVLESWMLSICYVRNLCAHHSRLWNRVLTLKPMMPSVTGKQWLVNKDIRDNKLYAFLCILLYMRKVVNPETSFSKQIKKLFDEYPGVNPDRMGFHANWREEPMWA